MPVGVADVEGYTNWVSAAPLDAGVEDVGTRGEPSVDALVALDPDLVVATTDLPSSIVDQIEEFVPVLVVRGASAEQPIGQMKDNLTLVAEAVDRTDEAAELIEDFDAALAEGAQQTEDAGLSGKGFAMADGFLEGSTVSIRMFADGSLVGAVGEELGMENAWTGEGDPDYGLAQTDVEGLTALGDVEFLYYANDNAGGDPFAQGLTGNAIWESLPFVESGDVHRLPDGIWMFGGPLSTEQFIDAAVEAVTS
jgi:ABC-type Fe3+-hydroxamate transport system substrate-binding protein